MGNVAYRLGCGISPADGSGTSGVGLNSRFCFREDHVLEYVSVCCARTKKGFARGPRSLPRRNAEGSEVGWLSAIRSAATQRAFSLGGLLDTGGCDETSAQVLGTSPIFVII